MEFTTENWNTPQALTLSVIDNGNADGDETIELTLTAHAAIDYNGIIEKLVVNVQDNEGRWAGLALRDGTKTNNGRLEAYLRELGDRVRRPDPKPPGTSRRGWRAG